jgi:hypothetical protein
MVKKVAGPFTGKVPATFLTNSPIHRFTNHPYFPDDNPLTTPGDATEIAVASEAAINRGGGEVS